MKKLIFLLFSLLPSLCLGSDKEHKEKILRLLNGMYEVVSWYDGKTIHRPPDVAGRWAFFDGKIMSIIHNRINKENRKSSIKWGHAFISNSEFQYTYTETLNIKGSENSSIINHLIPWTGMRTFKLRLHDDILYMTSNSGKQNWEISKSGIIYTDNAWGDENIFVKRAWKRITPLR